MATMDFDAPTAHAHTGTPTNTESPMANMMTSQTTDQQLRDTLARFEPRLAILFGSMARGGARPDSDLDVALLANEPLSTQKKMEIMEALALVSGRPVDLVDLRTVGEPLLGRILSEGRRILGPASEWGRLLSRHLLDQADFVPLQNHILRTRRETWIKR